MDDSQQGRFSISNQEEGPLEVDRALNSVRWIHTLGSDWTPDECREVLSRMSPFLNRPFLDGSKSRLVSNNLLMLIWGVVGDAHRELGEISASAGAYQKACSFRPSCAYGDFYADITLKYNMSDHYETALRSLVVGTQNWATYDRKLRTFAHVWSFARHPLSYLRHLKHTVRRGRRVRELHRRLAEHPPKKVGSADVH